MTAESEPSSRSRPTSSPAADDAAPRGRLPGFDPETYRQRNVVERAVNKLRVTRAVATRYDKRDFVYRGTIDVASIRIWLRDPRTTRYSGHALIAERFDAAIREARDSDNGSECGPLHGLPITLKDLRYETLDLPKTNGSRAFASHCPDFEAVAAKRLRLAGSIAIADELPRVRPYQYL